MNDALSRLMDLVAMGVSVVLAAVLAVAWYKKAASRVRAVPLFFVLFGPVAVAVHMAMHLVGVGIAASRKMAAGSFQYDFRFYSLLLMAGVLLYISLRLLQLSRPDYLVATIYRQQRLAACGWLVLVSVPTIPFTFIGSLPVQAVLIHLVAAYFVVKKTADSVATPITKKVAAAAVAS
ncbi:hypothetical protein [Paracnuella aquatica]|uniref:hypothetical protein n=1 Tax=Paracnuella aquatica TaxID=2268757 RepID=UPI000DEF6474|nr:hypothetical protein [Paracnuella aquatica]RPD51340.1 hypothetical protein DRJ53_01260 [Paracnuella aquatica]